MEPAIMLDCSHANSGKEYRNQPGVCAEIGAQIATGESSIRAVMIESHLEEGAQKISSEMKYGQSVTDSCVSWDTTVDMIKQLATDVRKRRATFLA